MKSADPLPAPTSGQKKRLSYWRISNERFPLHCNMSYLNPLSALGLRPDQLRQAPDKEWLKKEKKRLLAEFELNQDSVIELKGQTIDRTTVLKLFESLEQNDQWDWHLRVFQQPKLLAFLEESSLALFYSGDITLLQAEPDGFRAFIAPHFAAAFNERLFHAFRQKDEEEIQIMVTHLLPIPSTHHAACFKDTYRHLHSKIVEIEAHTQQILDGATPKTEVQDWIDEMLISILNLLPEYFQGIRDRYAVALEELAIAVHNIHQRASLGIIVIRQGLKLTLMEATRQRLQHILDQLLAIAPENDLWEAITGGGGDKKKQYGPWLIGAGVLAIAWAIYSLVS